MRYDQKYQVNFENDHKLKWQSEITFNLSCTR